MENHQTVINQGLENDPLICNTVLKESETISLKMYRKSPICVLSKEVGKIRTSKELAKEGVIPLKGT